jgi:hypothetical protein
MKQRLGYLVAIALTIPAGLASRAYAGPGAVWVHAYFGDVLYATMYYFAVRMLFPQRRRRFAAAAALAICYAIEALQLYHAPWIQAWRATRLGGLILGYGFLWSDLICYALGAGVGWAVDRFLFKR